MSSSSAAHRKKPVRIHLGSGRVGNALTPIRVGRTAPRSAAFQYFFETACVCDPLALFSNARAAGKTA